MLVNTDLNSVNVSTSGNESYFAKKRYTHFFHQTPSAISERAFVDVMPAIAVKVTLR